MGAFRAVFAAPKSIQATVTILENLHVILEKTPRDDIRSEILPLLFNAFESTTIQVQVSFNFALILASIFIAPTILSLYAPTYAYRRPQPFSVPEQHHYQ